MSSSRSRTAARSMRYIRRSAITVYSRLWQITYTFNTFLLYFAEGKTSRTGAPPVCRIKFPKKVRRNDFLTLPAPLWCGLIAVQTRGGYPDKFPWEPVRYLRGRVPLRTRDLSAAEVRRGRQDRAHRMPPASPFHTALGKQYKGNLAQLKLRRFTEILRPDVVAIVCNTLVLLRNHA